MHWEDVSLLPISGAEKPNEASMAFDAKDRMFVFIRRDSGKFDGNSYILVSEPPYTDWEVHDLGQPLKGPLCSLQAASFL